jgi:hypothetical protein
LPLRAEVSMQWVIQRGVTRPLSGSASSRPKACLPILSTTQQGDQCGPRRSWHDGAARGPGRCTNAMTPADFSTHIAAETETDVAPQFYWLRLRQALNGAKPTRFLRLTRLHDGPPDILKIIAYVWQALFSHSRLRGPMFWAPGDTPEPAVMACKQFFRCTSPFRRRGSSWCRGDRSADMADPLGHRTEPDMSQRQGCGDPRSPRRDWQRGRTRFRPRRD